MGEWMSEGRMSEQGSGWISNRLSDRVSGWVTKWVSDQDSGWMIDWDNRWMSEWGIVETVIVGVTEWMTGRVRTSENRMIGRVSKRLSERPHEKLAHFLTHSIICSAGHSSADLFSHLFTLACSLTNFLSLYPFAHIHSLILELLTP